ncbi:SIMPL domain-containing protein [Frigidibacter sp. MR17.24]|uniref:SIMPL domain-containing protein n=1 Tax=Frigidibacter sp. MR17.24 TaxID=3127345 RepID=UPI003012F9FA
MQSYKGYSTMLAAVLALAAAAGPALAEEHITVTGEGRVAAVPDMATITLGVVGDAPTAAEAVAANAAAAAKVIAALDQAGIAGADMQTSSLSVNPVYEDTTPDVPTDAATLTRFQAQTMLTVRVRALDSLGAVLDGAVAAGSNQIYGLGFDLADREPRLDEARRAAVADARRKADLYAEAAGLVVTGVESISEDGGYAARPMEMRQASFAKDMAVAEGEIDLSARVTVVFDFAPR